jgi:hypothetical protein
MKWIEDVVVIDEINYTVIIITEYIILVMAICFFIKMDPISQRHPYFAIALKFVFAIVSLDRHVRQLQTSKF